MNIVEHVREVGPYLYEKLEEMKEKYTQIKDHRGLGLMQGIELDVPVGEIINKALEEGLILISAGADIIRFVPPLIVTREDIDNMTEILDRVFMECNIK